MADQTNAAQPLGSASGTTDLDILVATLAKKLEKNNGRPWWRKQMDAWGQPTIIITLVCALFYGATSGQDAYRQIWKNRDELAAVIDPKTGVAATQSLKAENVRQEAAAKLELVASDVDKVTRRVEQLTDWRSYIEGDIKARRSMVDERAKAVDLALKPIEGMRDDLKRTQSSLDEAFRALDRGRSERLSDRDKDRERFNDALSDIKSDIAVLKAGAADRGIAPFRQRERGTVLRPIPNLLEALYRP